MATGYLIVQARTAQDALPLRGVQIWIMDAGERHVLHVTTDESGETELIALETLDRTLSLDPGYDGIPYTGYDVLAFAEGFQVIHITGIPILEDETAIQPLAFIPMRKDQRTTDVTEITIGPPAVSMRGMRSQPGSDINPLVLRQDRKSVV